MASRALRTFSEPGGCFGASTTKYDINILCLFISKIQAAEYTPEHTPKIIAYSTGSSFFLCFSSLPFQTASNIILLWQGDRLLAMKM